MTRYILHGGRAGEDHPNNTKFFHDLFEDQEKRLTILLCFQARPEQEIGDQIHVNSPLSTIRAIGR